MSPAEQMTTLQSAMAIVFERGDTTTGDALARHIGAIAVDIATGGAELAAMPGKRLHRIEASR